MKNKKWKVIVLPKISKKIKKLQPDEQSRIIKALRVLEDFPHKGDLKDLKPNPEWRLRTGDRRILFKIDESSQTIVITSFGNRGDVYK